MKMFRNIAFAIAATLALAAPVSAQWQVPNHAVPVGQGGGNIGFNSAAPGTAGQPLVSNGASVDPTFQAVPNSGLASAPANTVKCNPTGGTAAVQDCTGTQVAALIPSSPVVAQTLPFTITNVNTPCNTTINITNGPGTLALSGAAGFTAQCSIQICNTAPNDNAHHAVTLSGFPSPSLSHLWMGQCTTVETVASGAWQVTQFPGLFRPSFTPDCYADIGGSNSNDGMVSNVAANAVKDPQQCINIWQNEMDAASYQPAIRLTAGQINPQNGGAGCLNFIMRPTRVIYVVGDGGQATLRPACSGGNAIVTESDFGGYIIYGNLKLDCSLAASHPCYGIFIHQQNGADLGLTSGIAGGSVTFTGVNSTDFGLFCDSVCKVNAGQPVIFDNTLGAGVYGTLGSMFSFNQGTTVTNGTTIANNIFQLSQNSSLAHSGPITFLGTNSVGQVAQAMFNSNIVFAGLTVSGSIGGTGKIGTALNGGVICNTSATAIPGAGTTTSATGAGNGTINASNGSCAN